MWIQTDCCVQLPLPAASAETPLLAVFSYTGKQKPLEIERFLRLTLPKTPLCTVFYSGFMLGEGEATATSDVFELAVAQSTAIDRVFEPAVQKHRSLRRFQRHGRQKHCYLQGFLHFRAKTSILGNVQKHCKNQCFCPTKNGEGRHPSSSEITKSGTPASRQGT